MSNHRFYILSFLFHNIENKIKRPLLFLLVIEEIEWFQWFMQMTTKMENDSQELQFNVHHIIERLLENSSSQSLPISQEEIVRLGDKSKEIFLNQPIFLELSTPIKICGEYIMRIYSISNIRDFPR